MATIRRYQVPADSFDPNRPLNDLLQAQLEQFHEIEKRLPRSIQPTLNPDMPVPSRNDAKASNRYVATMTTLIRQRANKPTARPTPALVTKPASSPRSVGIGIAASASSPVPHKSAAKSAAGAKKQKSNANQTEKA